ncbi:Methionyl-tRNA formyltransferase [Candidatus Hartigia pinicola]|nr:Methionyl-tRNA formyltransferase [Candidatus Hartigia pinicola]
MSEQLNIIFAGTPSFAANHLAALLKTQHQVVGVLTPPDQPAGRGKKLTMSPVKLLAQKHQISIFQPSSLNSKKSYQWIKERNADLLIVVAYRFLLPKAILDIPRLGCLNVHGSLLPRWRGAAPIQRAILAGDVETGVTITQMDEGLDTGDILHKVKCSITIEDTSTTLYKKLIYLGSEALIHTLGLISKQQHSVEKQNNDLSNYAEKISKNEARINWQLPAEKIARYIRALQSGPMSYFMVQEQSIKVWQATAILETHTEQPGRIISVDKNGVRIATSDGVINILQLQLPGKKAVGVQDLLNSPREWLFPGQKID